MAQEHEEEEVQEEEQKVEVGKQQGMTPSPSRLSSPEPAELRNASIVGVSSKSVTPTAASYRLSRRRDKKIGKGKEKEKETEESENSQRFSTENAMGVSMWRFLVAVFTLQRVSYDHKREKLKKMETLSFLTAVFSASAYACGIFGRVFISSLAAAMQRDDPNLEYSTQDHANLLISVGVAYAIGKLVNGTLIDQIDPRLGFMFFSTLSAASVFLFSLVHVMISSEDDNNDDDDGDGDASGEYEASGSYRRKYTYLVACAILNAFAQSALWPAVAKFFYYQYRPAVYGKVFTILALGSRIGSVLTAVTMGAVLSQLDWLDATRVAGAFTFGGNLFMLATFLTSTALDQAEDEEDFHDSKHRFDSTAPPPKKKEYDGDKAAFGDDEGPASAYGEHKFSLRKQLRLYASWWSRRQFTLMASVNSVMAILVTFEGFISLWIANTLTTASSAAAAGLGATLPSGIAVSLILGGAVLEHYTRPSRATFMIIMLFLVVLSVAALTLWTSIVVGRGPESACPGEAGISACLGIAGLFLFLLGTNLGYPYYIAPSEFALHFGGEDAAAVTAQFDMLGSALGAGFASLASYLSEISWTAVLGLLLADAVLAFSFLTLFHWFELHDRKEIKASERLMTAAAAKGLIGEAVSRASSTKAQRRALRHLLEAEYDSTEHPSRQLKRKAIERTLSHLPSLVTLRKGGLHDDDHHEDVEKPTTRKPEGRRVGARNTGEPTGKTTDDGEARENSPAEEEDEDDDDDDDDEQTRTGCFGWCRSTFRTHFLDDERGRRIDVSLVRQEFEWIFAVVLIVFVLVMFVLYLVARGNPEFTYPFWEVNAIFDNEDSSSPTSAPTTANSP